MAKLIDTNIQSQTISSYFPTLQIVIVGAILGLLFWIFNLLIGRYTNSILVSSDIATILVATVGIVVIVTMRMPRPIIVVLSSAITLWGLAKWTSGLMLAETIIWDITLYAMAYLVYSWVARYTKTIPVLVIILAVIVTARIAISL